MYMYLCTLYIHVHMCSYIELCTTCTCNLQQVEINPHYIQEELSHLTEQCNTLNPNVERIRLNKT